MKKKDFYNTYHKTHKIHKFVIDKYNFTYRNVINNLDKLLIKSKMQILDIGSATGTVSIYMANKGNFVTGLEISSEAHEQSISNSIFLGIRNIRFLNKDIESYESKKQYDLVVCSEVLEHIEEDEKVLRKINKLIKKNGFLFITVPSLDAPLYKIGLLKKFDLRVGHVRRYKLSKIVGKLKHNGFRIIDNVVSEGLFRNIMFTINPFGLLIKLTKFKWINELFTDIDNYFLNNFGGSQIIIIAQKI